LNGVKYTTISLDDMIYFHIMYSSAEYFINYQNKLNGVRTPDRGTSVRINSLSVSFTM
jgi:hypothetical protein